MRNQKQQHHLLLLLSLIPTLFFFLHSLFLDAAPAACPASSNKLNISFPFLPSDKCHDSESSFVISNCESSYHWPGFTKNATNGTLNSTVVSLYTPPLPQPPHTQNSSYTSSLPDGNITLTWSTHLLCQNVCDTLANHTQISQYIPLSINLQEFAHSAFYFDSSNIILLFRCSATKAKTDSYLKMNSTACKAYEKECKANKDESYNCYQYMTQNSIKELDLPRVMNTSGCNQAMFFVALNPDLELSTWKPGHILLKWNSTGTDWLASTFQECARCLEKKGICGYNSSDEFNCDNRPATPSPSQPPDNSNPISNKTRTIVILAAGFLAMTLFMSLSLLALFCFWKKKKAGVEAWCSSEHDHKSWIKRPSFLSRRQDPSLAKDIPYRDLVCATENFADKNILGDGGFGAVYRGVLADGLKVAVKRLHHDNYRRIEQFYNEIKVLSNLNHPNLVKLFGFCSCENERELLLVFEYASQGTVSDHLHGGLKPPMTWSLRLKIACEIADALSYLHNAVNPPIYHRDVKTANILLDDAFHAKLADFGLSKLVPVQATHILSSPQGTPGYLDPEYHECYQLTDKSDVYSLGVVLMELLSGKLAVDMSRERGEINLSTMAVMKIQCGLLEELVDPYLEMNKDPIVERSIKRVVELAFACLHGCGDDRPSMKCIAETLAHIRRELEGAAIATEKTPFSSPPSVFFFSDSSCPSSTLSSS